MHKGLKEPHLFNAGSNPLKVIKNLAGILVVEELNKLRVEIEANVVGLFRLGESHFEFAQSIDPKHWRQRISRLYYGAYNVRRSVQLRYDGSFSTESSDHSRIDSLPNEIANLATYKVKLQNLRDDRNLADYNHLATQGDLIVSANDYQTFVGAFINDAKSYLVSGGIVL